MIGPSEPLHAGPTLETERLILRPWRKADLAPFTAMMAAPEVARYTTMDGRPQDPQAAWRTMAMLIGHWALLGHGQFVLEARSDGAFLGRAGSWAPAGWPGFEIGWALAPQAWGQGYASEAARAAGRWAVGAFGLDHMISLIHVDNVRSAAVAARIGAHADRPTLHAGLPHTIWVTPAKAFLS